MGMQELLVNAADLLNLVFSCISLSKCENSLVRLVIAHFQMVATFCEHYSACLGLAAALILMLFSFRTSWSCCTQRGQTLLQKGK